MGTHPPQGLRVDSWRARGVDSAGETQGMAPRDHRPRTRALQGEESTLRGLPGSGGLRLAPPISTSDTAVSLASALEFGLGLVALGLVVAGLGINLLTALMIGLGFVVYIGVYTLGLKRTHVSNIVIGGFAGSFPALAGSAAASNAISLPAILIALLVFLWTPGHFWALAFRSREDYRRAGLPMLPSVSDERTSVRAITFSSTVVAVASIAFVFTSAFDAVYLGVAIIAGAVLLGFTAKFLMSPSVENAWAGYKFSGIYLTLLLLGMMADAILRIPV